MLFICNQVIISFFGASKLDDVDKFFKRNIVNFQNFDDIIQRRLNLIALPLTHALLRGLHFRGKVFLTDIVDFSQRFQVFTETAHI